MILLQVSMRLDRHGWAKRECEMEVKETGKSYVSFTKRISKDKIFKVNTDYMASHKHFSFYTYTFEKDKEMAYEMLKNKIKLELIKVESELNEIKSKLNCKGVDYIITKLDNSHVITNN